MRICKPYGISRSPALRDTGLIYCLGTREGGGRPAAFPDTLLSSWCFSSLNPSPPLKVGVYTGKVDWERNCSFSPSPDVKCASGVQILGQCVFCCMFGDFPPGISRGEAAP